MHHAQRGGLGDGCLIGDVRTIAPGVLGGIQGVVGLCDQFVDACAPAEPYFGSVVTLTGRGKAPR